MSQTQPPGHPQTFRLRQADEPRPSTGWVCLAQGFRPFFAASGILACLQILWWVATYTGWSGQSSPMPLSILHASEMTFGVVGAAIAGFLLTAVPKWTDSTPHSDASLACTVVAWSAARVVAIVPDHVPPAAIVVGCVGFWALLLVQIGIPIVRARKPRNYGFPVLIALMASSHVVALSPWWMRDPGQISQARSALDLGLCIVAALIAVIGGRVMPMFTDNGIRRLGVTDYRRWQIPAFERTLMVMVAAQVVLAAATLFGASWSSSAAAFVALPLGAMLLWRNVQWFHPAIRRDPLLWVLHLGHACLGLSWLLRGVENLGIFILPPLVATHLMGSGAMGIMVLGFMSRVILGHTGRALTTPPGVALSFVLLAVAAGTRTVTPLLALEFQRSLVVVAGTLWTLSFLIFLVAYLPMLLRPRPDGMPG